MSEFGGNPEAERAAEIMRIRRACDEHLVEYEGVDSEDIADIFSDAEGEIEVVIYILA